MEDSLTSRCLSLQELCVYSAIDNLDYIRDVGQLDSKFLRTILPHCTVEQLLKIEGATKERDLSPITNDLWLKFYKRKFGVNKELTKMMDKGKTLKWKALYQEEVRRQEKLERKGVKSLTEKYKVAGELKASKQLQQIDLAPPSSKRKSFGSGGGGASNSRFGKGSLTPSSDRGRLMKKARKEYAASADARWVAAARKKPALPVRSTGLGGRR